MALDFLILYEHVVREYESILLLKAELARRGYTVELASCWTGKSSNTSP